MLESRHAAGNGGAMGMGLIRPEREASRWTIQRDFEAGDLVLKIGETRRNQRYGRGSFGVSSLFVFRTTAKAAAEPRAISDKREVPAHFTSLSIRRRMAGDPRVPAALQRVQERTCGQRRPR
jgi:hypothetical protein